LLAKLFNEALVGQASVKKCLDAIVRLIPMELDLAAQAHHLHPRTPVAPMLHNFIFTFEVLGAT